MPTKGKDRVAPRYRLRVKQRLAIVAYAIEHGVLPASRRFGLDRKTIREWRDRWRPHGTLGLVPRYPNTILVRTSTDVPFKSSLNRPGVGGRSGQSRTAGSRLSLRRPHPDALVSDPRPILHSAGLINSPDAGVDTLAACRRVRRAGDFPLTGLVGEAVSDLQVPREDVVGEEFDLLP